MAATSKDMDFMRLIEVHTAQRTGIPNVDEVLQEVMLLTVDRGLMEHEFLTLLNFFSKGYLSTPRKKKLLGCLVPCYTVQIDTMTPFMQWFISNYKKIHINLAVGVLQWIIGLLEHELVDPNAIYKFVMFFYPMLKITHLTVYACKLLCMLIKCKDIKKSHVTIVTKHYNSTMGELSFKALENKFFLAMLNVMLSYKPHLVENDFKTVDVKKILRTCPQKMDTFMKFVKRKIKPPINHLGVFPQEIQRIFSAEEECKLSALVPFPSFKIQGKGVTDFPQSIKEAFQKLPIVAIPDNSLSLLYNDTGFFLIALKEKELQERFSSRLLTTLANVLIYQITEASKSDQEYLLSRVSQLQSFMQQGVPCVSVFLSGYLLNWDGFDHRTNILNLIEWSTFRSFAELYSNILRPLFMLFVSHDVTMMNQIIQTSTNLIKNMMMTDLPRVLKGIRYQFLGKAPEWTQEPLEMLGQLVQWVEDLIKLGLDLEPENGNLLLQSIKFYEMMNKLEFCLQLPMWTILSKGVIYRSLLNFNPNALRRVCRLLLRYHRDFLPLMRTEQPAFYDSCREKINLTSKYVQELINCLWTGQAFSRKEDGVMMNKIPDENLQENLEPFNIPEEALDRCYDLSHNINFFPFNLEQLKTEPTFGETDQQFLLMAKQYVADVATFIEYFSPNFSPIS